MSKGTPTEAAGGRDVRARAQVSDHASGEVGDEDTKHTRNVAHTKSPTPSTFPTTAATYARDVSAPGVIS